MMKKLSRSELQVGKVLPWSVYNQGGELLLREGYRIESQAQITKLIQLGLYRDEQGGKERPKNPVEERPASLFEVIGSYKRNLKGLCRELTGEPRGGVEARILKLAQNLQRTCMAHPDGTLAALHLDVADDYSCAHPLHAAVISEMLARQKGFGPVERLPIVAAAITHDVGLEHMQGELERQKGPLSDAQWTEVKAHPGRGVEMLRRHGIRNGEWLAAVLHHHERNDGSGYPAALADERIPEPARILAIADIYSAMIRPRAYRDPILAKDTLRGIFMERGSKVDGELAAILIKEVGIYPPGSLLRLKSGEVGVVTRRGVDANTPSIHSIIGKHGAPLMKPERRDASEIVGMIPNHKFRSIWGRVESLFG
ncbi:HD-GYP domain-containing protein [Endothiovibrio diazotrophicus]